MSHRQQKPADLSPMVEKGLRHSISYGRRHRKNRGSTLIEFALVVPVLLALLLGIMEFGVLVNSKLKVANATREAARYAAIGKDLSTVRSRVKQYASPISITDGQITMAVSPSSANPATYTTYDGSADINGKNSVAGGDLIKITVDTPYVQLFNFFPFLRSYRLHSEVVFRREVT